MFDEEAPQIFCVTWPGRTQVSFQTLGGFQSGNDCPCFWSGGGAWWDLHQAFRGCRLLKRADVSD